MMEFTKTEHKNGLARLQTMKASAKRAYLYATPHVDIYEYRYNDKWYFAFVDSATKTVVAWHLDYPGVERWIIGYEEANRR